MRHHTHLSSTLLTLLVTTFCWTSVLGQSHIPTIDEVGPAVMPDTIAPIVAPFDMPQLQRPTFPDYRLPITKMGAKEGRFVRQQIQAAIDAVAERGGGTVVIPKGNWHTGRIELRSNVCLHVEEGANVYFSGEIKAVPDAEFEALLGRPIPDGSWSGKIQANDAIGQLYYAKALKARFAWKIMDGMLKKSIEKGEPDLNITFIYNMPVRAIGKMAGGMVSQEMCEGILDIINGHGISFCKGLGKIVGGFFKQLGVSKK